MRFLKVSVHGPHPRPLNQILGVGSKTLYFLELPRWHQCLATVVSLCWKDFATLVSWFRHWNVEQRLFDDLGSKARSYSFALCCLRFFLFWVSGTQFLASALPSLLPGGCLVPKLMNWNLSCGAKVLDCYHQEMLAGASLSSACITAW